MSNRRRRVAERSVALERFRNSLRGTRNPAAVYNQLRTSLPLADIPQAVLWLRGTPYRGNNTADREFPRSFARMRPNRPPATLALSTEFRWAAGTAIAFEHELRRFVQLSRAFGGQMLASSYDRASDTLATIEADVGKSLWGIKTRLLLLQLASGFEAQKRFSAEVTDAAGRNSLAPYITYFASVRNEEAISTSSFKSMFERNLAALKLDFRLKPYLTHHILPTFALTGRQCAEILSFESVGSAVDYYESLVELAAVVFSRSYSDYADSVSPSIQVLASHIPDQRTALLTVAAPGVAVPRTLVPSDAGVFDLFLSGDYKSAIEDGIGALASSPDCIELMEILARAAVLNGSAIDGASGALNLVIAERMRRVIRREPAWEDNLEYLSKLALNLHPIPPSHGLRAFCARERQSAPQAEACHLTPPSVYPPLPLALHATAFPMQNAASYLSAIEERLPGCVSTRFARAVLFPGDGIAGLQGMDPRHEILLRADRALYSHDYEAALSGAAELEATGTPYFQHKAIRIRTKSLLRLNRVADCLSFATRTYLQHPALHALLPLEELAGRLDKGTRRTLKHEIAVPILFDMYSRHVASKYDET